MNNNKLITVSVAAYNSENVLRRCLDSFIIPEIMDAVEVIIVNDGSSDKTSEIAHYYQQKWPNTFIVIDKDDKGYGSTINISIEKASGKYFKTVDADDYVDGVGLKDLISTLVDTDVDLIFSPFFVEYINKKNIEVKSCLPSKYADYKEYALQEIGLEDCVDLEMHGMTFKTALLKKSSYRLDENCFYVDAEYVIYYTSSARTYMKTKKPIYVYRIGASNQSMALINMQRRRNEHLKVVRSLLNFWNSCEKSLIGNQKELIFTRINFAVLTQYRIILSLKNPKISRKEMIYFDKELKMQSTKIYTKSIEIGKKMNSGTAKLIYFFRLINFRFYELVQPIVRNKIFNDKKDDIF